MTAERLKPCPFCGSTTITFVEGTTGGDYAAGLCRRCYMTGPEATTRAEAERLWNTRVEETNPEAH
jgi:Lar family restriction alleviation protein